MSATSHRLHPAAQDYLRRQPGALDIPSSEYDLVIRSNRPDGIYPEGSVCLVGMQYHNDWRSPNRRRMVAMEPLEATPHGQAYLRRLEEADAWIQEQLALPYPPPPTPKDPPNIPSMLPRGWILPSGFQIP